MVYGFHSLRHTAVTFFAESGVPLAVAQQIIGHRSPAITARYTHIGAKAMQEAVASLPVIGEAQRPLEDKENEQDSLAARIRHRLDQEPEDSQLKLDLLAILDRT